MASERLSAYQKFDTEVINRAQIKNAEYNPRQITREAEKALRKGLREHGLVAPITWNRRTGNIVGGHQRIKQLDALEKRKDYDLTVAVIDVDEREEAALNVQLNNTSMMGDWDFDKLADISESFDLDFDDMGFTQSDVDLMFDGDERFTELYSDMNQAGAKADLADIKASREKSRDVLEQKNDANYMLTIVFRSQDERTAFLRRISVPPYEDYVTLEQVERIAKS